MQGGDVYNEEPPDRKQSQPPTTTLTATTTTTNHNHNNKLAELFVSSFFECIFCWFFNLLQPWYELLGSHAMLMLGR